MKKSVIMIGILLIGGILTLSCDKTEDSLDEILNEGKMIIAMDSNYPPQSYLNNQGDAEGFDVDVAKEVCQRLGVTAEIVFPAWDAVTGGGWNEAWDISIGSMSATEERAENLRFTDPYYYTAASFAAHRDDSLITAVSHLVGKTIGVADASTYEAYFYNELTFIGGEIKYDPPPNATLVVYDVDLQALQALAQGGGVVLDAVLSAKPTIQNAIDAGLPLKHIGNPAFYEPLVFALDRDRGATDRLLTRLNEIVADMHTDSTLIELSIKWYGVDLTSPENDSYGQFI